MSTNDEEAEDVGKALVSSEKPGNRVVEAVTAPKQPPPESNTGVWARRLTIASFWAIAIFLGLPIWWKTTTIHRASLPLRAMNAWADGKA